MLLLKSLQLSTKNLHNVHVKVRMKLIFNPQARHVFFRVIRWYIRMQLRDWVVCVFKILNSSWNSSKLVLSSSRAYEPFLWQKWAFSLIGQALLDPSFDTLNTSVIFFIKRKKEKAEYCTSPMSSCCLCGLYRGLFVWWESWKCEEVTESMMKNARSLTEVPLKHPFHYSFSCVVIL